ERNAIAKEQGAESKVLQALTQQEKQFKQELQKKQQEDERLARAIRTAIQREIEEQRRVEEEARQAALALEAQRTGKTEKEIEAEKPAVRKSDSEVWANTPAAAKLAAELDGKRGWLLWAVQQAFIAQGCGRHTVGRSVTVQHAGINIRPNNTAPVLAIVAGTVHPVLNMRGNVSLIVEHG